MKIKTKHKNPEQRSPVDEFYDWYLSQSFYNDTYVDVSIKDFEGEMVLFLNGIHVKETVKKKKGIGNKIMKKLIEISENYKLPLLLEASEHSEDSDRIQGWYLKLGFEYTDYMGEWGPIMRWDN